MGFFFFKPTEDHSTNEEESGFRNQGIFLALLVDSNYTAESVGHLVGRVSNQLSFEVC